MPVKAIVGGEKALQAALAAAGDALVVVDFYADWCGPCKWFAPKYEELAARPENADVVCLKLEEKASRDAIVARRIRAFPTLHVYRQGQKVAETTGMDVQWLVDTIAQQQAKGRGKRDKAGGGAEREGAAPAAASAAATAAWQEGPAGTVQAVTGETGLRAALAAAAASGRLAVIMFSEADSEDCRAMEPVYQRLAAEHAARALCLLVDASDSADAFKARGVKATATGTPRFLFIVKGKEVLKIGPGEEGLAAAFAKHCAPG